MYVYVFIILKIFLYLYAIDFTHYRSVRPQHGEYLLQDRLRQIPVPGPDCSGGAADSAPNTHGGAADRNSSARQQWRPPSDAVLR